MITPQELRLGNWFNTSLNDKFQVEELKKYFLVGISPNGFCNTTYSDIEPIPLTPELLEKAGFEMQWEGRWSKGMVDIEKLNQGYILLNGEERSPWSNVYFYLHQLQNLVFALENSELEIQL